MANTTESRITSLKLGVAALFGFLLPGVAGAHTTPRTAPSPSAAFIENRGQWDSRALFLSRTNGLDLWISQDGPVFDFNRLNLSNGGEKSMQGDVVRMSFVGARPTAFHGEGEQPGRYNYMIGRDQSRWACNVSAYSTAVADQPYDGISVRYSFDQGAPRYDVIVQPGAMPSQVGLKIEGAQNVKVLENGDLMLSTSLGNVQERGLTAYQDLNGTESAVPCRMVLDGNILHFDVGAYDASKPLIIDPLVYSSYIGGSGFDSIFAVATDSSNNIYLAGSTTSTDFPITTGAYQKQNLGSDLFPTCFVTKMNATESALIFSTYLGGNSGDSAEAIAIDKDLDVYVTGYTGSADFPITKEAFQKDNLESIHGNECAFATKLNPEGSALVYSTLLGGSDAPQRGDIGRGIVVDSSGDAYVAGFAYSTDFPTTAGAFQTTNKETSNAGSNAFLVKVNPTGSGLVYGTFFGGSNGPSGDGDFAEHVAIDADENAYITGLSYSSNLPVTSGAFQKVNEAFANKNYSAFVTKFNSTGKSLLFSTYFGGSFDTVAYGIVLDSSEDPVIAGDTTSPDIPVSDTAFMIGDPELANVFGNGVAAPSAGFVAKLNSTGSALVYSTYLGGSGQGDDINALALTGADEPVVVGQTQSPDFPTTSTGCDTAPIIGLSAFVTELNATGTGLVYSTFLGTATNGLAYNGCKGVSVNVAGNIVVGGFDTIPFPTTTGAFDTLGDSTFVSTLSPVSGAHTVNLALPDKSVPSGFQGSGTINMTQCATTDTVFTLSATGPVSVASTAVIPAGMQATQFSFNTLGAGVATEAVFTATSGSVKVSASLIVEPPTLLTFGVPSSVIGGHAVEAHVLISAAAGAPGLTVSLKSSSTDVIVPADIVVTTGTRDGYAMVTTKAVSLDTSVTVTATLGATSKTSTLIIRSARVAILSVPSSCVGGKSVTATVYLSSPAGATGDVVAFLSSSADAIVPTTVTVPAGKTSVSFTIATKAVTSNVSAVITAGMEGPSKSATLMIEK